MNQPKVVMIGLGYIGLPTAALIAQNKTYVHGVDINPNVVDTINAGKEENLRQPIVDYVDPRYLVVSQIGRAHV